MSGQVHTAECRKRLENAMETDTSTATRVKATRVRQTERIMKDFDNPGMTNPSSSSGSGHTKHDRFADQERVDPNLGRDAEMKIPSQEASATRTRSAETDLERLEEGAAEVAETDPDKRIAVKRRAEGDPSDSEVEDSVMNLLANLWDQENDPDSEMDLLIFQQRDHYVASVHTTGTDKPPLASLTDHEEQATWSGSLARHEPLPDTDVQKTSHQLGRTLRLSLPCEQHHHPVHVDDGDGWPANREKRVPGFRSTKTPNHRGQTSRGPVGGDLTAPILPLVDEMKESWQQKKQLPRPNVTRLIFAVPCRVQFTQCQPHRRPVRLSGMLEETSSTSPMAEHLLQINCVQPSDGPLRTQLKSSPHQWEASEVLAPHRHHLVSHCMCSPTPHSLCPKCWSLDRLECPLLHSQRHALPVSLHWATPALVCQCAPRPHSGQGTN